MVCGGLSFTSFSHTKVGGDRLTQAKSAVTVLSRRVAVTVSVPLSATVSVGRLCHFRV